MTQLTTSPTPTSSSPLSSASVSILILGAGWTSTFLIPLLTKHNITYAATTRNGHNNTIPFTFEPNTTDTTQYEKLPNAKTVLITFPLKGVGQSKSLTTLYAKTHPEAEARWIQLGSTGIFTAQGWNDEGSEYDKGNARAVAENELLALLGSRACVLNLAGLYGGERQPRNWVGRVAKSKEEVRAKGGVHLIHGGDVARGVVLALGEGWEGVKGGRWIVCDLRCYDWWELVLSWGKEERDGVKEGEGLQYEKWVLELMREEGVRALPRDVERLGRRLDGRGFWEAVGGWPERGRLS